MRLIYVLQVLSVGAIIPTTPPTKRNRELECERGLKSTLDLKDGEPSEFVIDTDAGADDALAILYILGAERLTGTVRTVAITCVNGNTRLRNVVVNVLKTLQTAGRLDIPVYKGANESILTTLEYDNYFGDDGFGDFHYPNPPPMTIVKKQHAVTAIIQLVKKRPGRINIICLGPLTNIALAIRMYPNFLKKVRNIFVLGSATEGLGNIKPGIEFNFHVDPEAVFIVFKMAEEQGKIIYLMPWEAVAVRGRIPVNWRQNVLGRIGGAAIDLINKAEGKTMSGSVWIEGDPMLTAVAINDSLIQSSNVGRLTVETCGSVGRGGVFVDHQSNKNNVRIVNKIDMDAYKELMIAYLRN